MNLVGIALTLVAVAAWSFDPGSEARRLDDKDAPAPSAPALTNSKPTGARMVRVVLAEGRGAVEFELRGDWGEHQGHKLSGRISARDDGGSIRLSSGAWKLDAGPEAAFLPEKAGSFCLDGRCYRGGVSLLRLANGIAVVNRLGLEDYLLGVVPGEIGRRLIPQYLEAVKAQAIVARTYTLRSLGQYSGKPWDVRDDVRDQMYEGLKGEDSMCSRAVRSTIGQILVDQQGKPIDAYYHSTSGGRTADIASVWPQKSAQPYLRGIVDTAKDGRAWDGSALVASWTERWPVQLLHDSVRRDLTEALGRKVDPGNVVSLRLEGRDSSGRARKLVVVADNGTYEVPSDRIRWALRRPAKGRPILRSSRFELEVVNGEYLAEGTGYGHGVGMSQNGAMGRAYAGQSCQQILSAYYPGTVLRTLE
ncbi:MAG: hypothetical protein RL173_2412 [Fibrobacterota bacterium]